MRLPLIISGYKIMLIFLAFQNSFYNNFSDIVFMEIKLRFCMPVSCKKNFQVFGRNIA